MGKNRVCPYYPRSKSGTRDGPQGPCKLYLKIVAILLAILGEIPYYYPATDIVIGSLVVPCVLPPFTPRFTTCMRHSFV